MLKHLGEGDFVDPELDSHRITGSHHFVEMAQQPEACDVGAGMDAARVLLLQGEELLQGAVLAGLHLSQGPVEIGGTSRTLHGGGKQHAGANRSAQQQVITRLDASFAPGLLAGWRFSLSRSSSPADRGRLASRWLAGFERVPSNQARSLLDEC